MKINLGNSLFKKLTLFLLPISIVTLIIAYQNVTYKKFLHNFKNYFNGAEYSKANNLIINEGKYNIFKGLSLNSDLESFFSEKLISVKDSLTNNTIKKDDAQSIVNEITRYDLNNDYIDENFSNTATFSQESKELASGISLYENKKYKDAVDFFSKVKSSSKDYESSKKYLKLSILAYADELAKDDYYTKGIEFIKNYYSVFPNDIELTNKEKELTTLKEQYLANVNKDKQASNASIISSISTANINTLNLSSYTSYLIFVSLEEQKTYVYTGSQNKWNLAKTFLCSTGISGKDTPQGVYNITTRGDWFYAPKFEQGGKYWLSFYGDDYLFHSLPFAEDKKTVVDWTLGKKASHGCIRLPIEDSKWLYDNIPSDTKVIIK